MVLVVVSTQPDGLRGGAALLLVQPHLLRYGLGYQLCIPLELMSGFILIYLFNNHKVQVTSGLITTNLLT
jgi:hypothetical protein